jgi:hypothetical protein
VTRLRGGDDEADAWLAAFCRSARESLALPGAVADAALAAVMLESGFTGTDRLGRKWVDGREVKGDGGGAGGGTSPSTSARVPADAPTHDDLWPDLQGALPAEVRDNTALLSKARAWSKFAYDTVFVLASEWGPKLAPDILDVASDYEKIAYAKNGPQGQDVNDPFAMHLGVPYTAVTVVVSKLVGAAYGYFKGKKVTESVEGSVPQRTPEERQQIAEGVAELFRRLYGGVPGAHVPSPAEVLARMAERERAGVGEAPPAPPAGES